MRRVRHVLSVLVALLLCLSVGSTAASAALSRQDVHCHLLTRSNGASELGLRQACKVRNFDSSFRKVIGCSANAARGYDEIAISATHQNCVAATAVLLGIGSEFVSGLSLRAKSLGYDAPVLLSVSRSSMATKTAVDIEGANWAQDSAGKAFSKDGSLKGASRSEVTGKLLEGNLTPGDLPVDVVVRDGQTLILNTRFAVALEDAGIPRSQWNVRNRTGDPFYESQLNNQLAKNKLPGAGTPTLKRR